jgi:hypothetical protein
MYKNCTIFLMMIFSYFVMQASEKPSVRTVSRDPFEKTGYMPNRPEVPVQQDNSQKPKSSSRRICCNACCCCEPCVELACCLGLTIWFLTDYYGKDCVRS